MSVTALPARAAAAAPAPYRAPSLMLALRLAFREMRGGLRGFGIFIGCIALGVAAIVGVASIARGLTDGLAREGRTILGGDISVETVQRELSPEERAFFDARGRLTTAGHDAGHVAHARWRYGSGRDQGG